MNLQDSFLNQVRKEGAEIKIVLMDGSELIGAVKGFDNFTVILVDKGMQHLVYKHAIAQIISHRMPGRRDEAASPGEGSRHPQGKEGPSPQAKASGKGDGFNTLDLSRVTVAEES